MSLGATLPERVSAAVEQFQRWSNDVAVLTGPDVWVDGTEDWCECFGRVGGRDAARGCADEVEGAEAHVCLSYL